MAAYAQDPDLAAHWAFDEGTGTVASDSSTNNHTGTLGATASWDGTGYLGGNALSVDGTAGSHVRVADAAGLRFGVADDYSVSFWTRVEALPSAWQSMFWKGSKPSRLNFAISPNNQIHFFAGNNSRLKSTAVVIPGVWHHVVGVQDSTNPTNKRRLYVNGVEVDAQGTAQPADGPGDLFIGSRRADGYEAFAGDLDEVRIYSRVLSDAEILALANQTPGPAPPIANAGPDQTLSDVDGDNSEQVTLDGSASSAPNGSIVDYLWTEGVAILAQGSAATATLDLAVGTHTIDLMVTDNVGLTAIDTLLVTVNPQPVNAPPVVNAGPDLTVTLGDELFIDGALVTDDGLPDPPAGISVLWSEEGSAAATWPLGDQTSVATHVTFSAVGIYVLRLTADDGLLTAFDEVAVTVTNKVATPVITPPGGVFSASVPVSLSTSTSNATIYYTLNGSDPDETSLEYTGSPILVDQDTTLKARAYEATHDPSDIASASFVFQSVSEQELAGYWAFDEGTGTVASDSSTNNHTGTLGATAFWDGTGYLGGNALSVDGTAGSHVRVADAAGLRFGVADNYSVSFWTRIDVLPSSGRDALLQRGSGGGRYAFFVNTQGQVIFTTGDASNIRSPLAYAVGDWHHVVGVQDSTNPTNKRRLYVNGVEVAAQGTAQPADGPGDLFIGARDTSAAQALAGDLDEVRIYSRVLSDAEILALANQAPGGPVLPVAVDDVASTLVDTSVAINVLVNDSDPNGDTLAITAIDSPTAQGGTTSINDNGTTSTSADDFVDYTPAEGFIGSDTFMYTISDGNGGSDSATVTVTVNNSVPVANDDAAGTNADTTVNIDVLTNDSDPNGDTLTITMSESPTSNGGATVININGTPADPSDDTIDYTPAAGFAGSDTFTYTIDDGNGGTDTATVTVTVDNAAPVANDDAAGTNTDTSVNIDVLSNDTDANGDILTITASESPTANGATTVINDNGTPGDPSDDTIDYTPASGFAGGDTFTYTISDANSGTGTANVTVTVANEPPIARDDTANTPLDTPVAVDVLANDSDLNGDTLTITSSNSPTVNGGTATINNNDTPADPSDDTIIYTPASGFTGSDTFTYTIVDGNGGTATATVSVAVNNTPPVANDDTASTNTDTVVNIDVLVNDSDPNGDSLTITASDNPTANGGATAINNNGTPSEPADDTIDYTPATGFAGSDTFTYTIDDGNNSTDSATVTVTVANAAPVAVDDVASTNAYIPISINVLSNDTDANGDTLSITASDSPTANGGSTSVNNNGTPADPTDDTIDYAPPAGVGGIDTFTYSISDGNGGADFATVTVDVAANQVPTDIQLSNSSVSEGADNGSLVGSLTTSDPDAGDNHTYTLIDNSGGRFAIGGAAGNELLVADGSLLDSQIAGSHDVTVQTIDSAGETLDKLFTITVIANGTPAISITSHFQGEDVSVTGFVISGDATDDVGIATVTASVDDPLLGRTVDRKPLDFAVASGNWSLVVFDGQISLGQTITVSITATDTLSKSVTSTIELQVTAADLLRRHVINRITFGSTPALLQETEIIGAAGFIAQQLDPASIDDSEFETLLGGLIPSTVAELKRYQVLHAAHSRRQLLEVMTWFWENHFSTSVEKHGNVQYELDENNQFRVDALGNFRNLLEISAKSPAMLIYLDGISNVKANPNENYARELMELHTLGVNGGYTQTDVEEVARAFTGWTVQSNQFFFDANEHDIGPKTVLGQPINVGGVGDGEQVLTLLANHLSTANFICTKLITMLVSDDAPAPLVGQCATTFQNAAASPDQIAQVLTLLLNSSEFNDPSQYHSKVKTPIEFVVATARQFEAVGAFDDLVAAIEVMGMPLFENHIPTGFSETGDDWISSNLMLERMKFVNDIAYNSVGGVNANIDPLAFFPQQGFETAEGIVGYLIELTFGEPGTQQEWDTALGVLTDDGTTAFEIQAPDAEEKLRRLIGTVLSYPAANYQ